MDYKQKIFLSTITSQRSSEERLESKLIASSKEKLESKLIAMKRLLISVARIPSLLDKIKAHNLSEINNES